MSMSTNQPLTITVEQAAAVLGIGRSTAYELVRTGDLTCIRLRRRIVIPVAHLAERLDVDVIEYPELGMEAIWRIEVENFPAFIVVDDKGNDFFANI